LVTVGATAPPILTPSMGSPRRYLSP